MKCITELTLIHSRSPTEVASDNAERNVAPVLIAPQHDMNTAQIGEQWTKEMIVINGNVDDDNSTSSEGGTEHTRPQ